MTKCRWLQESTEASCPLYNPYGEGHLKHLVTLSPTYAVDVPVVASSWNLLMFFQNILKESTCSQLTCLLGSPFHRTRYSITGGIPCLLVTRLARIFFTSFSHEASDWCRPLHFWCLECCFFLPSSSYFPWWPCPCVCGLPQLTPFCLIYLYYW